MWRVTCLLYTYCIYMMKLSVYIQFVYIYRYNPYHAHNVTQLINICMTHCSEQREPRNTKVLISSPCSKTGKESLLMWKSMSHDLHLATTGRVKQKWVMQNWNTQMNEYHWSQSSTMHLCMTKIYVWCFSLMLINSSCSTSD